MGSKAQPKAIGAYKHKKNIFKRKFAIYKTLPADIFVRITFVFLLPFSGTYYLGVHEKNKVFPVEINSGFLVV
jgi:hypothetical protein